MGLRTMHWDEWIELDNEYLTYHSLKAARIADRGEKCIKTDPRAWDAAVELLEEMAAYLSERYPSLFSLETTTTTTTDAGKEIRLLKNLATNEEFDVCSLTRNGEKEDPMTLCARLVQDDLAIMMEGEDGQYYLLAGAILLAGFWKLEDKFGMGLSEIHTSGDVPGYVSSSYDSPHPPCHVLMSPFLGQGRKQTNGGPVPFGGDLKILTTNKIQAKARKRHDQLFPPRPTSSPRPSQQLFHPSRRQPCLERQHRPRRRNRHRLVHGGKRQGNRTSHVPK